MNLLPFMVNVSNNSRLTQEIHQVIENKFNPSEKASFLEWLKLIEEETNSTIKSIKRPYPKQKFM